MWNVLLIPIRRSPTKELSQKQVSIEKKEAIISIVIAEIVSLGHSLKFLQVCDLICVLTCQLFCFRVVLYDELLTKNDFKTLNSRLIFLPILSRASRFCQFVSPYYVFNSCAATNK